MFLSHSGQTAQMCLDRKANRPDRADAIYHIGQPTAARVTCFPEAETQEMRHAMAIALMLLQDQSGNPGLELQQSTAFESGMGKDSGPHGRSSSGRRSSMVLPKG